MRLQKRFFCVCIMLCLLVSCLPVGSVLAGGTPGQGIEYFVAVNGSDTNPGTLEAPFATLEKARDTIRQLKNSQGLPNGGIHVYLRGGTYLREQSFVLTTEDSGTEACPITYASYNGEKVVISGGYTMEGTSFAKVSDPSVLQKIPENARGQVYQFDLGAVGISNFPKVRSFGWGYPALSPDMQLMVDGKQMSVARYPNSGMLRTGEVVAAGKQNDVAKSYYDEVLYTTSGGTFRYNADPVIDSLAGVKDVLAWGYWQEGDWSTNDIILRTIDPVKKEIILDGPTAFGLRPNKNYYVYNALQLLDSPGEWYLDREHAILYMYPEGEIQNSHIQLNKADFDLISLNNASYITLMGLDMTMTLTDGVSIKNGSNNLIRACEIYTAAGNGVTIACNDQVNARNGVINSELYDIGLTCVEISAGNRRNL